jgi:hypothetical protein
LNLIERLKDYDSNITNKFGSILQNEYKDDETVISSIEKLLTLSSDTAEVYVLKNSGIEIVSCRQSDAEPEGPQTITVDYSINFVPLKNVMSITKNYYNARVLEGNYIHSLEIALIDNRKLQIGPNNDIIKENAHDQKRSEDLEDFYNNLKKLISE